MTSLTLRTFPFTKRPGSAVAGDLYLCRRLGAEGTAVIDPTIPPLDAHELYQGRYREPHANWGLDFTETARTFSVPIRIRPMRARLG